MLLDVDLPPPVAKAYQQLPAADQKLIVDSFFCSDLDSILPTIGGSCRVGVAVDMSTSEFLSLPTPAHTIRQKLARYLCDRCGHPLSKEAELSYSWANQKKAVWGNYNTEVRVSTGRIDLVFPAERLIIEAKFSKGWKGALGQALAYREVYRPGYTAALLLLGNSPDHALIEQICAKFQVVVYWFTY